MAQIFKVLVRCPYKHKVLDTGIRTSGRESLSTGIYDGGRIRCPECRQFHSVLEHGFFELEREELAHDLWRPNP
ncbi:MAG: hypothetical protein HXY20_00920 [Acidobacteria bacterium]|nr:hypothetical protein [Acidobacteriota bacterium]